MQGSLTWGRLTDTEKYLDFHTDTKVPAFSDKHKKFQSFRTDTKTPEFSDRHEKKNFRPFLIDTKSNVITSTNLIISALKLEPAMSYKVHLRSDYIPVKVQRTFEQALGARQKIITTP